jgi:hypothetical protein
VTLEERQAERYRNEIKLLKQERAALEERERIARENLARWVKK